MSSALSGNFSETSFSDLVADLWSQKATGVLVCTTAGIVKQLYLSNGRIIFASSSDPSDRLGEVMVKNGSISRAQLGKAVDLHAKAAGLKKIGAIFVEQGYVSPKELFNGLKSHVLIIIQSLFLVTEGTYRFTEDMPSDVIPLQIDMEELLREVIQQMKQGQ